jgi:hypothetical protein
MSFLLSKIMSRLVYGDLLLDGFMETYYWKIIEEIIQ